MPDHNLTPDSFMAGLSSGPNPRARTLTPDSFMASQQNSGIDPQGGMTPIQPPVDALTGLPLPHDARANAEQRANDIVNNLEALGQRMQSSAIPPGLKPPATLPMRLPDGSVTQVPAELPPSPMSSAMRTIVDGAARFTGGVNATRADNTPNGTAGVYGVPLPAPTINKDIAGGASDVVRGAMDAAAPMLPATLAAAPIETVAGLGTGALAQTGTEAGLKKAGVPDEYAELAGNVAGLGAGIVGAHVAGKFAPKPALEGDVLPPERTPVARQVEGPAPKGAQTIDLTPDQFMAEQETPAASRETKAPAGETARPQSQPVNDKLTPDEFMAQNEPKGQSNDNTTPASEPRSEPEEQRKTRQEGSTSEGQRPDGQARQSEPEESASGTAAGGETAAVASATRTPATPPAYGKPVNVYVPGESTVYPARYALRELDDVETSHNPHSFEPNTDYEYVNDRDYSNPQNAARVAEYSAPGNFNAEHVLTPSTTAEQGPTIIDQRGNALGGNNRGMVINRVYASKNGAADSYRSGLAQNASQYGIDPNELQRFQKPVLVRELTDPITPENAQKAITDFNKVGAGRLTPEEQAVTDGKRMSPRTISMINGNLGELGDEATLAQALRGDKGAEIVNSLVNDGVITRQEANGYVDDRDQLTPAAKDRIGKALVGRLFDKSAHFAETRPELRNKLEKIAPHVIRTEDMPEWNITQPLRDALGLVANAKAHKINLDDAVASGELVANGRTYSPDVVAIAKTLQRGPLNAAKAFRTYANDADMSRDGAQTAFFEPPTQREAFDAAFREPVRMQASLETKTPRLSTALQKYYSAAPEALHGRLARVEPISLSPENAGRARAYVANSSAMELLARAGGMARDSSRKIGGVHISPDAVGAQRLAQYLQALLRTYQNAPDGLVNMVRAAHAAAAEHKSLILIHDAPQFSDQERLDGLNEELDHAAQRIVQGHGDMNRHLGNSAESLLGSPAGTTAYRSLGRIGYSGPIGTPGVLAAEMGVRLMAPGRYRELGLNLQQARALAAHYVRSLRKEYGYARPREIANRIFDALPRPGANQSGELPGSPGPQRGGGSPGGTGQDLSHGPGSTSEPSGRLRPSQTELAGINPDQGRLFSRKPPQLRGPSMFDAPDTGERALFHPDEARQVVESAAADKARLERERMEAQLKSPLTRESQKQRLKPSAEEPTRDLFGSEEPDQGVLFSLPKRAEDDPAKVNYSGLGAIESKTVRNLGQLRRASEPGFDAAVRAASSRSQASVVMKTAMPKLVAALGKIDKEDFFRALIQSRLSGIQQRWQQMADFATRASDDNVRSSMDRLIPLLDHMQRYDSNRNLFEQSTRDQLRKTAVRGMGALRNAPPPIEQGPLDLGDTAASLADKNDFNTLRAVLSDLFSRAAQNVAIVMDPGEFKALTQHPDFKAGLKTYKDLVEKQMAESHELNEGIFSTALGPLDTYYPLVPVDKAEHGPQAQRVDRQQYARPKNLNNNFATGLADDYEASTDALRSSLTRAIHTNNKAALMDVLEENGLVRKLGQFERGGDRVVVNGQEFDAVKVETSPGRTVIQKGKSTFLPPKQYLVPRWLNNELEPILTRDDKMAPSLARKIMNAANTVAISGPADFVFHSSNLFGTLVANTPFLGDSLLDKAGSAPVLKKFTAIAKVLATDPTTEESARDLQEMAKLGILPDRYGSETYSKKYAELTGATLHRLSAGPMLYGPKGVDVRARLVMYRLARSINPDASGPELHMFVNQLGTYVDALQGQLVRSARKSGLAPFAEAGKSMLVNGVNAWTGMGPMPKSGPGMRIWQQLTGGGLATVAMWMLAHKAYTGKYPWEDKRSKLLSIPANPKDRASTLGRALWGKGSDTGYINFGFFNPLALRGARALGIKGAADTAHLDGKWWQDLEAAIKDAANSFAHPFLGPIPRAAFVGLSNTEPYLTGLRDDRARPGLQFYPMHGNRIVNSAKELNAFYGNVGVASGLGENDPHDTSNRWVRMAADLALPGLVGQAQNPYAQRGRLIRQAAIARRIK